MFALGAALAFAGTALAGVAGWRLSPDPRLGVGLLLGAAGMMYLGMFIMVRYGGRRR